ncbi:hypothetical protein ACSQ76_08250 [Roseovarius sp. B08]|uniref:hypothetical protein n=1 Tax=Roseovarius sp. B08 TaxID=3449223 RepID=UPI003EDB87FA
MPRKNSPLPMEQALARMHRRRQLWYNARLLFPDLETFKSHLASVQRGIEKILAAEFAPSRHENI